MTRGSQARQTAAAQNSANQIAEMEEDWLNWSHGAFPVVSLQRLGFLAGWEAAYRRGHKIGEHNPNAKRKES